MDVWERIRYARDRALQAEEVEQQRLAEAETVEMQQAASVRLATRQAVCEALDDVLDEQSDLAGAPQAVPLVVLKWATSRRVRRAATPGPPMRLVRWWARLLLPTMRSSPMPVLGTPT